MVKRNTYLRGMTRVAYDAPETEVNRILRAYKHKVPGARSTVHFETSGGKHTLYIPTLDSIHLGLEKK